MQIVQCARCGEDLTHPVYLPREPDGAKCKDRHPYGSTCAWRVLGNKGRGPKPWYAVEYTTITNSIRVTWHHHRTAEEADADLRKSFAGDETARVICFFKGVKV